MLWRELLQSGGSVASHPYRDLFGPGFEIQDDIARFDDVTKQGRGGLIIASQHEPVGAGQVIENPSAKKLDCVMVRISWWQLGKIVDVIHYHFDHVHMVHQLRIALDSID